MKMCKCLRKLSKKNNNTTVTTRGRYSFQFTFVLIKITAVVTESVNILASPDGKVISSEVLGTITMQTRVTGMPQVRLGLNDEIRFLKTEGDHIVVRFCYLVVGIFNRVKSSLV